MLGMNRPTLGEMPPSRGMDCFGHTFTEAAQRRRLSSQVSSSQVTAEGIIRTPSAMFRQQREDSLLTQLTERWTEKRDRFQPTRDDVRKITQQILLDVLASEWLSEDVETAQVRIYLVDHVLPTLMLGLEKLLVEVDKKGLVEVETTDRNFNPINHLAQYLMRNNPKYSNFSEASPYIRGLRNVSEQLKQELLHATNNKLAHMKSVTQKKREIRETEAAAAAAELKRRREAIEKQFYEWHDGRKVPLSLIQNALSSFAETHEAAQFSRVVDSTDETGKAVYLADYALYVRQNVGSSFSSTMFDEFVAHAALCASYYRQTQATKQHRETFADLFKLCDHTKIGVLDRSRLFVLFGLFYKKSPAEVRERLLHPLQWPISEIRDAIDLVDEPKLPELEEPKKKKVPTATLR